VSVSLLFLILQCYFFSVSSIDSKLQSPKSLLTRRLSSRTNSVPPSLLINPKPNTNEIGSNSNKPKDFGKKDPASKLRQLAEIVTTSPRSPYSHSPIPSLTPSLLVSGPEGSADWTLKSPSSKFPFHDKAVSSGKRNHTKVFLLFK